MPSCKKGLGFRLIGGTLSLFFSTSTKKKSSFFTKEISFTLNMFSIRGKIYLLNVTIIIRIITDIKKEYTNFSKILTIFLDFAQPYDQESLHLEPHCLDYEHPNTVSKIFVIDLDHFDKKL